MRKLLPPVLLIIFVVLAAAPSWIQELPRIIPYPYNTLGSILIVLGLSLAVFTKQKFTKMHTTIMTFDEPEILINDGVFSVSRNPIYLGLVISLFGFSILLGATIPSLILSSVFWLIVDRWYVRFEEQTLAKKFGNKYHDYCRTVPRWF